MDQDVVKGTLDLLLTNVLGVDRGDLSPDVSLVDDLALDSLDLLEVAIALEDNLGVAISEREIMNVRTYDDLVRLTSLHLARAEARRLPGSPPRVTVRIVSPVHGRRSTLERSFVLTPYAAQLIAEDIRGLADGRVEVTVPADTPDAILAPIERQARAAARAVDVAIHRQAAA